MTRRTSYYLAGLLLAGLVASCVGHKQLIRKADAGFLRGEYAAAGELYRKAYPRIPHKNKALRAEIAFRQGEAYRLINHPRAEQVYQNAIRNKYPDSIVYLHLAQMQHKNGKYREAEKNYTTALAAYPDHPLAHNGLAGIRMADSLRANPSRYIVQRDKAFNATRSSSFSPAFVGAEAEVLVFTSNRKQHTKEKKTKQNPVSGAPNNHLFEVKKNSQGQWEKPEPIAGDVNTENDEGVATASAGGDALYFTRSMTVDSKGKGTFVAVSNRAGGTWSAPQAITLFNDSSVSAAHPALSPDGTMLYFVSDAPHGYGGKDIYRTKLENGKPTYIENLGTDINTPGNEMFPTFRPDGTLFFSSDGHPGLGGLDIFEAKSVLMPDSSLRWQVTNPGIPLNSGADDFGMAFAGDTNSGYFSSGRAESRGADAIWSFLLPELEYHLEGKVHARSGNAIPEARISIVGSNGDNARIVPKPDGSYRFRLSVGVDYQLLASANGFLNARDSISTHTVDIRKSQTFVRNFTLTPTFSAVKLEHIYYDFDKTTLRPESKTGLDSLIAMLNEHPTIGIELSAHTDYKGNNDYNRNLSAGRAQAVIDYLIAAGIDGARLKAIGYGEAKPFVVDARHARLYDFLPEGSVLTEEYVHSLPPDHREVANQLNRRTEFVVIAMPEDKQEVEPHPGGE